MRWWTYQKERFPVFAHGPLILAFSSSAVCFSALLRGETAFPPIVSLAIAFVVCLIFFLQLRIADEFKDIEEDTRYRPYRAVPRGLVTLRELGWVFVFGAIIQAVLSIWLEPKLLIVLGVAWAYLAMMSVEFFAREWLVARPITYLWTHMLIMPLVDFFATACDWLVESGGPPNGLGWFLAASFFNGCAIELGRKIRKPEDEEEGVRTYSILWGQKRAGTVWLAIIFVTGVCAVLAAREIDFFLPVVGVLGAIFAVAAMAAVRKTHHEMATGIWTLALYLMLGLVPILVE
ncbi:MAG: UbiA family prenyltransferase [Verrucomicrobiales bacterium]|nr:UbiA family prenyltransferase [Verrucomicrobiales bacterium]